MTKIESGETAINQTAAKVFGFLSDCNNYQQLMPEQVVNWQSTHNACSFTIQGTVDLALKIAETSPNNYIHLLPDGKKPFDFVLKWEIKAMGDMCTANAILEADLNMFLKMVAVRPLENFLKYQATQLKTLLNG